MRPTVNYLLLIIALSIKNVKGEKINYLDIVESLNTIKILDGLLEIMDPDSPCFYDMKEYKSGILSDKLWAIQMYDSSAKIPNGLLLQQRDFLGHFDECIEAEHPEENFTGQYCQLYPLLYLGNRSIVTEMYQRDEEPTSRLDLVYGICLPSTCSLFEIGPILKGIFWDSHVFEKISIETGGYCQTKKSLSQLNAETWIVIALFGFIVIIAIISTCCDLYQQDISKRTEWRLVKFFSIYNNGQELLKISKNSDQLKVIHGMRVLSIFWIILHNAYEQLPQFSPIVDRIGAYQRKFYSNHVFVTNGYLAVDSFFFISGLLVSLAFFRDMAQKGYYDVPLAYVHRYIRLTPPFAATILLTAVLFPHFGNGPIWPQVVDLASGACKQNWWLGLLYVQNYATNTACLDHTWYLSADMQLQWISPLVLYPLFFWPSSATVSLTIWILAAVFITFLNAYVNDLGPNDEISMNSKQTKLDYMPTHTRAAPWLIGVALGYALSTIKLKKIKIKLSKFLVVTGWLASTGLCVSCLYGPLRFSNFKYSALEAALFLAFHRAFWGLGLAWIVFACAHGYGGPVNKFLSWSVYEPLAKLSYSSFLVHVLLIYFRIGVTRVTYSGSDIETMYFALGDIILSFLAAIPLTLLFEMPFRSMYGFYFQNVKIFPFPKCKRKRAKGKIKEDCGAESINKREKFV